MNPGVACASGCPATEYGVVDTDLQCYSCSGASCDVCPPNTCTDCSCTHISEVAATECVSARPATEYGVVDTDLQCSSGSDASCDACPSQHLHRLQQHLHLGRGGDERLCVPCDRVRRRGTDRQGSSCSDASCDVCPSNTCTDSSSICILDVAGRASLGASRPSTASWTHTRSAHLAATRAATSARPTRAPTAAAHTS